jgi:hypothetical protein
MEISDSRRSTADHSDLTVFIAGLDHASTAYSQALEQVERAGSRKYRSSWRKRFADETRRYASRNLERTLFPFYAGCYLAVAHMEPAGVEAFNAWAVRERRKVHRIQEKGQRLEDLRSLAQLAGFALCEYCWKIITSENTVSETICSQQCQKGLWNRSEYVERNRPITEVAERNHRSTLRRKCSP